MADDGHDSHIVENIINLKNTVLGLTMDIITRHYRPLLKINLKNPLLGLMMDKCQINDHY